MAYNTSLEKLDTIIDLLSGGVVISISGAPVDLSGLVPYTGATTNVNLGTRNLNANTMTANVGDIVSLSADIATIGSASDYVEVEPNGFVHLHGEAKAWYDISMPAITLGTGAVNPSIVNIDNTSIKAYAFIGTGVIADELHGGFELPHEYKEGSDLEMHLHWCPQTNDVGTVIWQLEYAWVNDGISISGSNIISTSAACTGTAWEVKTADFSFISGAGKTIGGRFLYRLFRDPAHADDTYGFNAVLLEVGAHILVDAFGSRNEYTK